MYLILILVSRWDELSSCTFPFSIYLSVDYASMIVFKALGVIGSRFIQNRQLRRFLGYLRSVVLVTFILLWTIVWNFLFVSDYLCMKRKGQSFTILNALMFSYVCLSFYGFLMYWTWKNGIFEEIFIFCDSNRGGLEDALLDGEGARHGLTVDLIASIPSYTLESGTHELSEQCSICLEAFCAGDQVKRLEPCGHYFHSTHIDEWLLKSGTCPLCRSEIQPSQEL